MDKKDAFKLIVANSQLLTDTDRENVLSKMDSMSEQEITTLGTFLAQEYKNSLENYTEAIRELDQAQEFLKKKQTKK